jgi:hypothetical protein
MCNVVRKSRIDLFLILNLVWVFLLCASKQDYSKDALYIDPIEINDSLLWVTIVNDDIKEQNFKTDLEQY